MEIYNNSTLLQDRYKGDFVSVVDIYSKSKDPIVSLGASKDYYLRKMTDFVLKYGMMYTKAGDAAAIFMGGLPNYTYYKSEFKKKNPNATANNPTIEYSAKAESTASINGIKTTETTMFATIAIIKVNQ